MSGQFSVSDGNDGKGKSDREAWEELKEMDGEWFVKSLAHIVSNGKVAATESVS